MKFLYVIFKWILVIDGWGISFEIALIWMSLDFTNDQSTLVQVMAWCRQATSHYLSQCWPRSLSPYGVTRSEWVNVSDVETRIFGKTRPLNWLAVDAWLFVSPGHLQSWYWLFRKHVNELWCSTRKDFKYLHHLNAEYLGKMQIVFDIFPQINSAWQWSNITLLHNVSWSHNVIWQQYFILVCSDRHLRWRFENNCCKCLI